MKQTDIIPTEEFVKKFPRRINNLLDHYCIFNTPEISYRTFRYYVTKGYMPKPIIQENKSYYQNTPEMVKRLFAIWYLAHFLRKKDREVKKIMDTINSKTELQFLLLSLNNQAFLEKLLNTKSIKQTLNYFRRNGKDRIDIKYVLDILRQMMIDEKGKLPKLLVQIRDTENPSRLRVIDELEEEIENLNLLKQDVEKTVNSLKKTLQIVLVN